MMIMIMTIKGYDDDDVDVMINGYRHHNVHNHTADNHGRGDDHGHVWPSWYVMIMILVNNDVNLMTLVYHHDVQVMVAAETSCPLRDYIEADCKNLVGLVSRMKDR